MQTILCLLENNRLLGVDDRIGDLLAPMGGETVHKNSMRSGDRNQFFIYLVWLKYLGALIGLVFATHARPSVRVNGVCPCYRIVGIAAKFDCCAGLPRDRARVGHNLGVRLITRGSSDSDM